jgi:hypothetical protein
MKHLASKYCGEAAVDYLSIGDELQLFQDPGAVSVDHLDAQINSD